MNTTPPRDITARVMGIVTARGGSVGIPGKNLKLLSGKPLIAHTVTAAFNSHAFDRLVVSTNDPVIADVARSLGCEIPFMRPDDLARDTTPHLPVVQHAVAWLRDHDGYEPDYVMVLQPTSPARRPFHICEAIDLIIRSGADSVVSVSEIPAHFNPMRALSIDETGLATLLVTGQPVRTRINRRQDMPVAWTMNGAIYLCRTGVLFEDPPSLYGDTVAAYRMDEHYGVSIDEPSDWAIAERALENCDR